MKKMIPIIVAIVLILAIAGIFVVPQVIEKYSYSQERYDMKVYFENKSESDVAIIKENSFMPDRAYLEGGVYYVDLEFVHNYLNKRFYYDDNEQLLIYTTPTDLFCVQVGSDTVSSTEDIIELGYKAAIQNGESLWVALDYVKKWTNFEYTAYTDPGRIQMYTEWNPTKTAVVLKDTAIRHRGGVKSEILKDLSEGDKVTVIEQMEEWAKVRSEDGIIGYVENKRLKEPVDELLIPVNDYSEPEYTNLCRDYKINMGWHAVAGVGGNDTLESVVAGTSGLNVISPTWFSLSDSKGNYTSFGTDSYVNRAHNMGLEVWPTLNNTESTVDIDYDELLGSTTNRQNLIMNVINEALLLGIDGINVDIEMLPASSGKDFAEFVRELSIECRKNGLVLSIDNYVPIGNTDYYDRATQGEVADYVVIMGYDEHYAGSETAGPVASIGYVETGIINTLEEVPASKVINGIPFYSRIWDTTGVTVSSSAVDMKVASDYFTNHSIEKVWDDETCQYYGEFTEGGTLHQIWLEDAESIEVKLNVMEANGIAGVAEWRLGYETPDVWEVIGEYLNK